MSARAKATTRPLGWLFLTALVGVLVAVGLVVGSLFGTVAVVAYAVIVISVLSASRLEREKTAAAAASGRSCNCCTTSQHDPVKVI